MNLSFILRDLASLQGLGIFLYQSLGWKSKERSAESGCIINSVFHCLVSIDTLHLHCIEETSLGPSICFFPYMLFLVLE